MKSSLWCAIGVVGLLALGSLAEAAEWVQYAEGQGFTYYYDASSIRRPSKDIVRVWTKWQADEKAVEFKLALRRKYGLTTADYEKYGYEIGLYQINCTTEMMAYVDVKEYTTDGVVLDSYRDEGTPKWRAITPESTGHSLYRVVCKQKGKR